MCRNLQKWKYLGQNACAFGTLNVPKYRPPCTLEKDYSLFTYSYNSSFYWRLDG